MRKLKFYFIILIINYGCNNDIKESNKIVPENIKKDTTKDVIPYFDTDRIDTSMFNIHLKAIKTVKGICINYRLKNEDKDRIIEFVVSHYSDIIFPNIAIGLIKPKSYSEYKYYISGDSILILPLIGVNNLLSIYVINLKTQNVLGSDMRTSFDLVWISSGKELTFLTSDTPTIIEDTIKNKDIYKYVFEKTLITNEEIISIKRDSVLVNHDIKEDDNFQYRLAKKILQKKN